MVTKAKKALLASLTAFLCVMLTVFGLSMSASSAKIAKADDTATELTDYVIVGGIKGFEEKKFASFEDAYNAIKPTVETLGLGQETPANAAAFDAIFTDVDENGNATLTYTIKGNVVYDETNLDRLLTMGRQSSHYLTNERHLIKFAFVGVSENRADTLTVNSNITLPYEWWGEKTTTSISFENLTITGSAPSGLYTSQPYFEGIDFTVNNCTLQGIKIYNCANVGGTYTITNSTLDGTGAAAGAYAIHLQGNETAPLTINISGNEISGYDRGVNIDQKTAVATISDNTISVNDKNRSCIQLTQLAETTITGNTLNLTGGNAITLHSGLAEGSKITVESNTISGTGYLIYDDSKNAVDLTYGENTVAETVDMTKGIYSGTTKDLSEDVYNEVHHVVAEVGDVKYETLQAAIDAAAYDATVTLLANTRENVTVSKNRIVLDLNGYTINGGTEKSKPTITVNNKKLTIIDSVGTGKVMREDTAENSGKGSHYVIDIQGVNGFLVVEGGNFVNNSGNDAGKGASLIRVGDDRKSAWPTLTIKGGTFTQDNFVVIKIDRGNLHFMGGTLNSANSYAIENWNNAFIKGGKVNGAVSSWVYSGGAAFSKLEISGGMIKGNVTSVNYGSATDKQAIVNVIGGTINGELDTRSYNPTTGKLTSINDVAKATIEVTGGTFNIDPSKYVTEAALATKNEDGTFGVKKAVLAKIGTTEYYTMDDAFKAVKTGETIVLQRNYTIDKVQNSGDKSFTIDLNTYTWTYIGADPESAAFNINYANRTLTVKNGTVVSNSMIGLIPTANSFTGTITYDNAGLVFENVMMTANGRSGFETSGNNTNDAITLIGGELHVDNGYGIYFASTGTLTIDGTKIFAKTMGVQVCSGSLVISGDSEITVADGAVTKTENDGAIEDGAAISIVDRTGYKGLAKVTISGGKFTAKEGNEALKAYKWANLTESEFDNSTSIIAVNGGTFSSEVDNAYLAEDYKLAKVGNLYGVVEKYIVSSKVSLGVDLSFKYKVTKDTDHVDISYYKVGAETPTVYTIDSSKKVGDYYVFDGITPQMIDRKISVTVYAGDYIVYDLVEYSILDNLQGLLAMNLGEKADALISALVYYGKAAMSYVEYDLKVVNDFIKINSLEQPKTETMSGVMESDGREKVAKVTVQFAAQNKILVAVAETVFQDYGYVVMVNGDVIEDAKWQTGVIDGYRVYVSDGYTALQITDENCYVKVQVLKDNTEVQYVKYNVAGYCVKLAENEQFGEMAKATYYYGVAAAAYANA